MMSENDIQKCLFSYGFFPMTKVLQYLEKLDKFEECGVILKAMNNYREKFSIVEDNIPTQWSEEFEKEYFSHFSRLDNLQLLARKNLEYYIQDIKKRLNI